MPRSFIITCFLLMPVLGCGGGSLPPMASPDQARSALTTALEAWKSDASIEALTKRQPPIYFNEPRLKSDAKLLNFQLRDSHEMYGQSVRIEVDMTFQQKDGTTKERKVSYLIDTSPAIVIVPG
jgi:hypothetical protein